jgi:hypothetical protein
MTIFRHKKNKSLYTIYCVSPIRYTGSWYEAIPLFPDQGKKIKHADLKHFEVVAIR